jgi:hypothetical protein
MFYSARYVHKIAPRDSDMAGPFDIPDGAFSDRNTLAAALRKCGALVRGARLRDMRVEADRIVVFPALPGFTTYWHSIILTPA